MYKMTRVRRILQMLYEGESERQIARSLHVSRNTIAEISAIRRFLDKPWEDIFAMDDSVLGDV